jgi:hypothetical protein
MDLHRAWHRVGFLFLLETGATRSRTNANACDSRRYIIIDIVLPLLMFMLFGYQYVMPVVAIIFNSARLLTIEADKVAEEAVKITEDVVDAGEIALKTAIAPDQQQPITTI